MEINDGTVDDITLQKRRNDDQIIQNVGSKAKKAKTFSIKEFRKRLNSNENLNVLKEFLSEMNHPSGHDYGQDYLQNGGSCLELLQTLERDSATPPTIVFELVAQLLLTINASLNHFFSSAHESCKYLLNNYLQLVHKMLGLNSSREERKACLKLLTAMAAFSPNLAKDVLINVKFHSANIELLTKHTGEANSVRDCFIHFLTAFLVDSDLHTLSILLEKSGLLTGIISGLQYDAADTVCMVVAAMRNHILENSAVTKTSKMHVFNTAVVKDIVNLYNWKGPEGLKVLDKNNRTFFEVDKVAKSKVSECVHDFLLVLCTSHRHGVIFRDHTVGLGKKNQNSLMYTVLDSLDRPWEHSYASELVTKICSSCPDLTKNVWSSLKPFLEPRMTEKWLNAMNFGRKLIKEMEPNCIEYCARDLNPQQLAQIIEILVSPSPILKVILHAENDTNDNPKIKEHISGLLYDMLEKIDGHLQAVKKWSSVENYTKVKQYLSNYVVKNYPSAEILLEDWKEFYLDKNIEYAENESKSNKHVYLETVLNIASFYKNIAPSLLSSLMSTSLDLKELLPNLASQSDDDREKLETLQMKIISIFVDIDHSYFLPKTEIFSYIVSFLLQLYHKKKSSETQLVLHKILKNTGIFGGSTYEINIWLNGIFNFSVLTEEFAENFVQITKNTYENILDYQTELSQINVEEMGHGNGDDLIKTLLDMPGESENNIRKVKHRHFSPLVLGLLKHLQNNDSSKSMKKYSEFVFLNIFHYQTILPNMVSLIETYSAQVPANILNYIQKWGQGTCASLAKMKGTLEVFKTISETFLNDNFNESFLNDFFYPDFLVDLLQMFTFYFSSLIDFELVSKMHSRNWIILVDYMCNLDHFDDRCLEIALQNPTLIKHFNVVQLGKGNATSICTEALIEVLKKLKYSDIINIEQHTKFYSSNIFNSLVKVLKKPKKYLNDRDISKILEVCPLDHKDCTKIITQICNLLNNDNDLELTDNSAVLEILTYCLDHVLLDCHQTYIKFDLLEETVISKITLYLTLLNKKNRDRKGLSKTLKCYLEAFPHCISYVEEKLFSSILQLTEYDGDSADLAVFLLSKNPKLAGEIEANIDIVAEKKGVILPMVHVLVDFEDCDDVLKVIYNKLEASILKALQKPQKVGQHFLKNYNIGLLIEKFMPLDKCKMFAEKAQKFEVTEVFHVKLLEACYDKILKGSEFSEKQACSIVLTFVHLEIALFKKKISSDEDNATKVLEVSNVFNGTLEKLALKATRHNFSMVANNETFKSFCKFALKYGVSGQHILLSVLRNLIELMTDTLEKDGANLLLEMLLSHSEFLNIVLGEHSETKFEVLRLFLTICRNWNDVMERSHVAVILAAYRGMVTRCDRTVLALLKLYESKAEQTRFFDFKPFLWGRAAAAHYSVRTQIESSLTRQPKISDVLGIIKEDLVHRTITNHPLRENLHQESEYPVEDLQCYDLKFLLPLFSHILAPEQQVRTYVFSRSGALSLTVAGLGSQDTEVRQAACHVLSRFHFHLEARQTGKDNLLWIRFVEALCKGVAVLPDFKLNNFASIFYARMALILTNPKHVMYTPLSSYLTAKEDLDLSTVPELYTLLFSPDVNFKEHRNFILEILRDGLRTEKDFVDFLKSMGFKLFSELFSSCLSDMDSKLLILDVLFRACSLTLGVKVLCENYSLLAQLHTLASTIVEETNARSAILPKLIGIFSEIIKVRRDLFTNQQILNTFMDILKSDSLSSLKDTDVRCFYNVLYTIHTNNADILTKTDTCVSLLFDKANDEFCNYIRRFGCNFISAKSLDLQVKDKCYFLRLLVYKLFL